MSFVFVLDTDKKPLNPMHPGKARYLLNNQKAAVFRQYPFTIILKKSVPNPKLKQLRIKIDPGSKTTGFALVTLEGAVVWAAELTHRGQTIKSSLLSRRQLRIGRRARKTRYRQARFLNRTRPNGWLPPSLNSRVENILTLVIRPTATLMNLKRKGFASREFIREVVIPHPEAKLREYQYNGRPLTTFLRW